MESMEDRTNRWLAERLRSLHGTYFADVAISNTLFVRFGRASRTRLGSIVSRPHPAHGQPPTYITVNALLRDPSVPEYVIDGTLLHELTHYAHGFHSPHPRLHRHPHQGGVVNQEIRRRGAGEILSRQDSWIRSEYARFLRRKGML